MPLGESPAVTCSQEFGMCLHTAWDCDRLGFTLLKYCAEVRGSGVESRGHRCYMVDVGEVISFPWASVSSK